MSEGAVPAGCAPTWCTDRTPEAPSRQDEEGIGSSLTCMGRSALTASIYLKQHLSAAAPCHQLFTFPNSCSSGHCTACSVQCMANRPLIELRYALASFAGCGAMWGGCADGVPVLSQARKPPQGGAARWGSSAEGGPAGKKTQGKRSMGSCQRGRRSQRSPLPPRKPGKHVRCIGEDCIIGMACD